MSRYEALLKGFSLEIQSVFSPFLIGMLSTHLKE